MERIVEYAKRVSEFRSLRKKTILVKEDEIVKNILSLVLQMFEVSAKEDNMIFDNLTINGKNEKLSFEGKKNKLKHKLIIGDNYDALLNLLIEYRNRIDVIYIDPPYGKDNMGENEKGNDT